jgi:hypothetical protein
MGLESELAHLSLRAHVIIAFDIISACLIILGLSLDFGHIGIALVVSRRLKPGPVPSPIVLVPLIVYLLGTSLQFTRVICSQYRGLGGAWFVSAVLVLLMTFHIYAITCAVTGDTRWFLKLNWPRRGHVDQ